MDLLISWIVFFKVFGVFENNLNLNNLRVGYPAISFASGRSIAYDGDGKVDVIEINERFAYRLLPGLKFEVINYGMGC